MLKFRQIDWYIPLGAFAYIPYFEWFSGVRPLFCLEKSEFSINSYTGIQTWLFLNMLSVIRKFKIYAEDMRKTNAEILFPSKKGRNCYQLLHQNQLTIIYMSWILFCESFVWICHISMLFFSFCTWKEHKVHTMRGTLK